LVTNFRSTRLPAGSIANIIPQAVNTV